jgi:RHS repeat-associated protein
MNSLFAGSPNKSPTDLLYDGLNRVRKTILPLDQASQRKEIVPTYNRAGALEKIDLDGTLYVRHIAYNAKGQRTLMAMGSGMMTRYAYDSVNFRLQRILSELYVESSGTYTPNGRVQQDLGYHYDLGGNIVGIRDKTPATLGAKGPGDLLKQFTYDPLKRLLTATGRESTQPAIVPSWDQNVRNHDHTATNTYTRAYEYDQVGNVLQEQHTATGNPSNNFTKTFSFALGKPHNRITRFIVNSTNYGHTYDACGNLLTENTNRHHQWGWNDSLRYFMNKVGMSTPTVWAHYLYDAAGQRVKKVVNKTGGIQEVTVYIDGVFEHSYVKRTGSIDVNKHYNTLHVMDARSRIATVRVGTDNDDSTPAVKYNLEDHLGTSCAMVQQSGAILVNREEYYPFGETCFGAFAKKRYRYVGKEKDNESGLYYYGARYYAPWTCRFVSVDPLAADYPHLTPYNYAGNKPIGDLDIDGLQGTDESTGEGTSASGDANWGFGTGPNNGIELREFEVTGTRLVEGSARTNTVTTYTVNSYGISSEQKLTETQIWHTGGGYYGNDPDIPKGWMSEKDYMSQTFQPLLDDYRTYVYGGTWVDKSQVHHREGVHDQGAAYGRYADFVTGRDRMADWMGPALSQSAEALGPKDDYTFHDYSGRAAPSYVVEDVLMAWRAIPSALIKQAVSKAAPTGAQYSVAYEMKLAGSMYPGKGYYTHFKAANTSLSNAIALDAKFAKSMTDLGIAVPRSSAGTIMGKSPANWVWHHDVGVGVMQLVPKSQHTTGSIFWNTLHPNGIGGMSLWGK